MPASALVQRLLGLAESVLKTHSLYLLALDGLVLEASQNRPGVAQRRAQTITQLRALYSNTLQARVRDIIRQSVAVARAELSIAVSPALEEAIRLLSEAQARSLSNRIAHLLQEEQDIAERTVARQRLVGLGGAATTPDYLHLDSLGRRRRVENVILVETVWRLFETFNQVMTALLSASGATQCALHLPLTEEPEILSLDELDERTAQGVFHPRSQALILPLLPLTL